MKKSVLVVAVLMALVASGNTTWYRNCNTHSNGDYLKKLQYWNDENGKQGSGDVSATDDLVVTGEVDDATRLRTSGFAFQGNSLSIGEVGGVANELCHDSGAFTFANDGLKLYNGNWFINTSSKGKTDVFGPITVYSPEAASFNFHVGQDRYSNAVSRLSGPITGAAGTGLVFGNYGKGVTSATNTTFIFGNIDAYKGRLTARVKNPTDFSTGNYNVRLLLSPDTDSPTQLSIYQGCEVGVNGESGTAKIGSLEFFTGSGLRVSASNQSVPCLEVTGGYSQADVVRVRLANELPWLINGEKLPILRAPKSADFSASDFTLVGGDGVVTLTVRETDSARELCLESKNTGKLWTFKNQVTSSGAFIPGDLAYFQDLSGVAGEGAPGLNDMLVIPGGANNNYRARSNCGEFTGKSLQLGSGINGVDFVLDYSSVGTALKAAAGSGGFIFARGEIYFNSRSNFSIEGPVKVLSSTASEPFAFVYGNTSYSDRASRITGPIAGEEMARLTFGIPTGRKQADSAPRATFVVGDVTGYAGSLEACNYLGDNIGTNFGVRLLVEAQTTLARVSVAKAGEIGVSGEGALSVKSLEFKDTARLYVGGTNNTIGCMVARDDFVWGENIAVHLNALAQWSGYSKVPILVVPLSSKSFTADDVTLVKGANCLNQQFSLVVEEDEAAGTRTLYLGAVGVISQVAMLTGLHSSNGEPREENSRDGIQFSSLTNGASWSDGLPVHAGCHYYTDKSFHSLYEPDRVGPYEFPGFSLTLASGGRLFNSARIFQVPELICESGSTIQLSGEAGSGASRVTATNIVINGTVNAICHEERTLVLDGPLSGSGTLTCAGASGTSSTKANFELLGDNSGFLGRIVLDMLQKDPRYVSFDRKFSTLFVNSSSALGGGHGGV